MPVITPVGHQVPDRTVLHAVARESGDVVPRVVEARQQRIPAPHRRAHVLRGPGLRNEAYLVFADARRVQPVEQRDVIRQQAEDLRHLHSDVAPEHRLAAALRQVTAQLRYEVGVHRGHAATFGFGLGTAATQVERLIAADVELACAEQLHVSIDQLEREREGLRFGDVERVVTLPLHETVPTVGVLGKLAEMAQLARAHRHVLVSESRDRRHQLDAEPRAVFVERDDVGGLERAGAAPSLAQIVEHERVLDV